MRDFTGKPVEDMGDKYSVLKGPLGNTLAKTTVAPVQKNLLWALVDSGHEVKFKKDQSCVWHPGTGRWQHIRRVRGKYEMDFALEPFAAAPRIPKWHAPAQQCLPPWDPGLWTMSLHVVWMNVPETQLHESRNSEVKRFLKLTLELAVQAEERAQPMLRNRRTGPTLLEREEHCRTHEPYRAWCPVCIAGRGRADPHAMRTESEKSLPVVGVDYGYLWSRSAMNAGDVVVVADDNGDPPDGVRRSSPVLCGRNSRDV